jgi:heterodisulfide reductase subunit C
MYELKRLAIEFNLVPKNVKTPIVSKLFVSIVDKYGRISETELVSRFMMKTNPLSTLNMIPRAYRLFMRRRLPLLPHRIKGTSDLRKSTEMLVAGVQPGASSEGSR